MEYKQAKEIAVRIYKQLQPFCLQCDIAGSVRREKPEVKDVEICCVPRVTDVNDLFGGVLQSFRSKEFVKEVKSLGIIVAGSVEDGRMVKIDLYDGIRLDLFIPVATDYIRQYAIRTGSREYSHKVLANAWAKIGWAGTENGLRRQSESYQIDVGKNPDGSDKKKWICNALNPTLPPVFKNEFELFQFLKLTWIEPKNRNV